MTRPACGVILVNWRQVDLTVRAAMSVASQLQPGDCLIIVDNASGDGSWERLCTLSLPLVDGAHLLTHLSADNGGFAAGVNQGIALAREHGCGSVMLLNNDAVAAPGALEALLAPLEKPSSRPHAPSAPHDHRDPSRGEHPRSANTQDTLCMATTARMLLSGTWEPCPPGEADCSSSYRDARGQQWRPVTTQGGKPGQGGGAGVVLINSTGNEVDAAGNGGDRNWLEPAHNTHPPAEVFGVCGGACALSLRALEEIGDLREDLFMYYEDTDLSWRLRAAGYAIRYVEEAVVHHDHGASMGPASERFVLLNARNRLIVAWDHGPWGMVARAYANTAARALLGPHRRLRMRALTQGLTYAVGHLGARRGRVATHSMPLRGQGRTPRAES